MTLGRLIRESTSRFPHRLSARLSLHLRVVAGCAILAMTQSAASAQVAAEAKAADAPAIEDITGDGMIDQLDLEVVVGNLDMNGLTTAAEGDLDGDGQVGPDDVRRVLELMGTRTSPRDLHSVDLEPRIEMVWGTSPHHTYFSSTYPGTHTLAHSSEYPPNHLYSISINWPPHTPTKPTDGWPPNHEVVHSQTWPVTHAPATSQTWPPSHVASSSPLSWPPGHTRYWSNKHEPDTHIQAISTTRPANHVPETSTLWPNNHLTVISQTWPYWHSVGESYHYPPNHHYIISETWVPLVDPTDTWPPNHDAVISRTWVNP